MKQVMQEEYLPNDYFEDFYHVEDTVEDISYEVKIVEVIEDEPLILEVEDCDPTINIDCTLNVDEAKLEAKSISTDKVSKGDNLFENPNNFYCSYLKIVFLRLDFEDPTLLLLSEDYSFKPVIDKMEKEMATAMVEDTFEDDQLSSMTTNDIVWASRLLDNEICVLKVPRSLSLSLSI
ncbi:hypothetical protein Ddye_026521 [Dipteronia dyeriana]|uniref:Uncharacterized protein n=1 Tax=Dipteronia dyeriana TaxID=168575 RepID=A0AAD9TMF7_9ROSI|nr:hypothetical protein Ddye_026521 [Dipteronia dyeriana]